MGFINKIRTDIMGSNDVKENVRACKELLLRGLDLRIQMIAAAYALASVAGLMLAFHPSMEALQSTNCLLISWVLALTALGLSVVSDGRETSS